MLDAFKQLVESGVMSEEVKSSIEAAFTQKIQENRDHVTAELREEFAQKYNHDKTVMVEAIDKMLSERLAAEMAELYNDKKSLAEAKAQYQQRIAEDAKKLEGFVINQLGRELVEFQGDRKKVSENFGKLEQFVVHALAKEIGEFAVDKRDLAETKVKLVREAKSKFDQIRQAFITQSAKVVESTVTKKLTSEIKQLKEDIDSARNNDFGRRLYEAFAQEYSGSFLNEKSETSKLLKIIAKKDEEVSEAQQALNQIQTIAESKERELRVQKDLMERKEVMGELLAPLSADKREIMKSLLESVSTQKLRGSYDKYLPAVLENNVQKPKAVYLKEAVEVTGDRETKSQPEVGSVDNIIDIRKLAGLK
jgi:adenosyl cobinamide kinase/adenosyl cobinamide phosphate guanylyltransferase